MNKRKCDNSEMLRENDGQIFENVFGPTGSQRCYRFNYLCYRFKKNQLFVSFVCFLIYDMELLFFFFFTSTSPILLFMMY